MIELRLSLEDAKRFFNLYFSLLFYVNEKLHIVEAREPMDIGRSDVYKLVSLRNHMYDQPELIDEFVEANPFGFSDRDIRIVESWKHFVRGTFYVLKQLKDYAVFLSSEKPPKVYGVLALASTFDETLPCPMPCAIDTVLLPFEGRIASDGLFATYSITFGGGMKASLNDSYEDAKAGYGIITSLPFSPGEVTQTNADRLRFYLKNERNRERYSNEIWDLMSTDPSLRPIYHQEMGKYYAKVRRRQFKEAGLLGAWFAVLEGLIIASGPSEREARDTAQRIVPEDKKDFIHVFEYRPK